MDELVRPGDLEPGDVIALPDEEGRFRLVTVRLGQGGFILTVVPANGKPAASERRVTLTAATRLCRYGHSHVY